jgi:secondary thiamine-phosphate synthase enzyme
VKQANFSIRTDQRLQIRVITSEVNESLATLSTSDGICTIFTPHTTAALTINENADPDVLTDLTRAFAAMVPRVRFDHGEGNSDAHLLSSLIGVSLQVPFRGGSLLLGRWQGIYFVELDGPRQREVWVLVGDGR